MTTDARVAGIYALVDLTGAPLRDADLKALGLVATPGASVAIAAVDTIAPSAVHLRRDGERHTAFVGFLDEPRAVASALHLADGTPHADLARAALDRFGADTPGALLGGWMMLDADRRGGGPAMISLLVGFGGRGALLYAINGNVVAIAPSIHALRKLDWIGHRLNERAVILSIVDVEDAGDERYATILAGVRCVPRGGCLRISPGRSPALSVADPLISVPRWTGNRRDAMAAADALLVSIVRQSLDRAASPGLLLSGGLDSSLIACAIAEATRASGASPLPALTSAAAPERHLPDESPFAEIVADTLGLDLHRVVPPHHANVYSPTPETIAASNIPPLSPRDFLYAAFADTAAALGVTDLFDGAHGELTYTSLLPVQRLRNVPRNGARWVRDALFARDVTPADPIDAMLNVAIAPSRLARHADYLRHAIAALPRLESRRVDERWGYHEAATRPPLRRDAGEVRVGTLRFVRPFHDIRVLRLFASFPAGYGVSGNMTRWPARALMAGRLPDTIRLRRRGMPFSPDYDLRLAEQAPRALSRIAAFRAAGCDEWFDLSFLADGLRGLAAGHVASIHLAFRIQLTAHACEFLVDWRGG